MFQKLKEPVLNEIVETLKACEIFKVTSFLALANIGVKAGDQSHTQHLRKQRTPLMPYICQDLKAALVVLNNALVDILETKNDHALVIAPLQEIIKIKPVLRYLKENRSRLVEIIGILDSLDALLDKEIDEYAAYKLAIENAPPLVRKPGMPGRNPLTPSEKEATFLEKRSALELGDEKADVPLTENQLELERQAKAKLAKFLAPRSKQG